MKSSFSLILFFLTLGLSSAAQGQSVGTTRDGHMDSGTQLPLSGPGYSVLEIVRERNFRFGTACLIKMIKEAGMAIQKAQMPDFKVGNISRKGGGDIPQSRSHNSGRDFDIAFYVLDNTGRAAELTQYATFSNSLQSDKGAYTFDIERNWQLVKTLIETRQAHIAWIFVANHLRDSLLKRAAQESLELQLRAATLLKQPSDSAPHDDHFHIRIYCDPSELPGCVETVSRLPWVPPLPTGASPEPGVTYPPSLSNRIEVLSSLERGGWTDERAREWNRLTNHWFDTHDAAITWYKSWSDKPPREWWNEGYRRAKCPKCVDSHLEARVKALIKAIEGIPSVSYRARLDLAELTGNPINTAQWSSEKGSRFWHNWWRKNAHRYGL